MIQETIKTIFLSLSSALSPPCTYKFREIINSKLKLALRFPTIEAVAKKDRKSSAQNIWEEKAAQPVYQCRGLKELGSSV